MCGLSLTVEKEVYKYGLIPGDQRNRRLSDSFRILTKYHSTLYTIRSIQYGSVNDMSCAWSAITQHGGHCISCPTSSPG